MSFWIQRTWYFCLNFHLQSCHGTHIPTAHWKWKIRVITSHLQIFRHHHHHHPYHYQSPPMINVSLSSPLATLINIRQLKFVLLTHSINHTCSGQEQEECFARCIQPTNVLKIYYYYSIIIGFMTNLLVCPAISITLHSPFAQFLFSFKFCLKVSFHIVGTRSGIPVDY